MRLRTRRMLFGNPLYALSLGWARPTHLRLVPPDPWPGNAEYGQDLLSGIYRFAGETIQTAKPDWTPLGVGDDFLEALHGFAWLRDLRALGGDTARRHARHLVDDWLAACGAWHPVVWRPDVIGRRLASWVTGHDFFCASADDDVRRRIFASMARQLRHLARTAPGRPDAWPAVHGMVLAVVCLPGGERHWPRTRRLLDQALPIHVPQDGGVADRNPMTMALMLQDLIDLRATLHAGASALPLPGIEPLQAQVQTAIERVTLGLRSLRHGDGRLALFHGAQEGDRVLLDTLLSHAGSRGRVARSSIIAGYRRLSMGRVVILMDVGAPPSAGFDRHAHAAPLAVEISVGRERLVVNCGAWTGRGGKTGQVWHTALRGTAAHSALTLGDAASVPVHEAGGLGPAGDVAAAEPGEAAGGLLAEATHTGYATRFGLTHRRRIWIAETGDDIRGEDTLSGAPDAEGLPDFLIRFHLHPDVQAALTRGGDSVLLRLGSGQGWRFQVAGGALALDESVYVAGPEQVRATSQIVVSGPVTGGDTTILWALKRERRGD